MKQTQDIVKHLDDSDHITMHFDFLAHDEDNGANTVYNGITMVNDWKSNKSHWSTHIYNMTRSPSLFLSALISLAALTIFILTILLLIRYGMLKIASSTSPLVNIRLEYISLVFGISAASILVMYVVYQRAIFIQKTLL